MLLTFAHIQKDDSLVPLLPYAAGCFLASVLLTISGIAETHPQALALATYLIQFGWLLLQIQGAKLVQRFGTHGQCMVLFNIWVVAMQVLDVHRRALKMELFSTAGDGSSNSKTLSADGRISMLNGNSGADLEHTYSGGYGHGQEGGVVATVRAYYISMLCNALPAAWDLSGLFAPLSITSSRMNASTINKGSPPSSSLTGSSSGSGSLSSATTVAGMREMEYLVLFEIAAGLGVSVVMCTVWLGMTIRQGGSSSMGVWRWSARVQRIIKTVKGRALHWRAILEDKVERCVGRTQV
ncbi:hypothetical protein BGZ54_007676 [Gamsiella multidivaricata]|nr:hypothetical protein BGZ54_007676 [Gamsiella multidivaricata]